nr:Eco57I restriction-modification methylase domain-containing protein [Capnocytophaga bilenii]
MGNPPYQVTTENTSDTPVYHLFIDLASKLSQRVSLITPARYLFNAGKTPEDWNTKILNDKHFKVVWYKANSTDVFPNVDIEGGIAVMYRDSKQCFEKIGTFTAYPQLNEIVNKVETLSKKGAFAKLIYAPESYRLSQQLHKEHPWVIERLSKGHPYDITTNIFEKLPEIFTENIKGGYCFFGRLKNERCYRWIKKEYIVSHPNLEKFKVIVPKSNGSGALGGGIITPIIGEPIIGEPLTGSTQTFISIGAFNTREEAEACLKYVKTKFARTMLGVLKATQDNKKKTWNNVPLQDFTSSSDIDWSQTIEEIDKQLYTKYHLSEDEIAFIERMIKPMV